MTDKLIDIDRLAESVFAVTEHSDNRFSQTFAILANMANELSMPIAIVGGMAGIYHGSGVTTLDIDVVIGADRVSEFVAHAVKLGFRRLNDGKDGWENLESPTGVHVEILPSGGRTPRDPVNAPAIPTPQLLGVGTGLGYAEFAPWFVMKLVAGRDKDRYHLVEALKHSNEEKVAAVAQLLRTVAPQYLGELQRLVNAANDERTSGHG